MEQKNNLNINTDMNAMSMDETEDEEVKRNCFGMKHYESSGSEEQEESGDDSVQSGIEKCPIKFGCHKPLGNGIVKPTPVAHLQSTQEDMNNYGTSVKKCQIIHNECAFSEEEGSDNEEVIVDITSASYDNESSVDLERDQSDDSGSESDSGSPTDASCDDDESAVEVEVEVEVDSEDDDSNDDDLSSQSESSSISDADDESSDTNETSFAEHFDDERVEIDWAVEGDASSRIISKVSGRTNDDESVSADEIQNLIEKPEASDMCFSENEVEVNPEKELDGEDYDVMDCLIDPDQEIRQSHMQPLKRVLSAQQAMQVTPDDDGSQIKRSCRRTSMNKQESQVIPPFLPFLSLGQSARSLHLDQRNRESPQLTVSTQEDVVDNQLAEELLDDVSKTPAKDRDPVPLLTPPTTPIEERLYTGQIAICEWPSNLAVDNAFTAAIELRSLSPFSLAKLEEQDPSKNDLSTPQTFLHQRIRSVSEISSTGLTPMLSSMGMPNSLNHWR